MSGMSSTPGKEPTKRFCHQSILVIAVAAVLALTTHSRGDDFKAQLLEKGIELAKGPVSRFLGQFEAVSWGDFDGKQTVALAPKYLKDQSRRMTVNFDHTAFKRGEFRKVKVTALNLSDKAPKKFFKISSDRGPAADDGVEQKDQDQVFGDGDVIDVGGPPNRTRGYYLAYFGKGLEKDAFLRMSPDLVVILELEPE